MNARKIVRASIPVELSSPEPLDGGDEVFDGEYEVPYFGHHLSIVDIGACIGSFALWANLRWPQSRIHCYEPHPGTFEYLKSNVAALENVVCANAAVYPKPMRFAARGAGDSEAALEEHARRMFEDLGGHSLIDVEVIHPAALPAADVVKIDTEGAELEILSHLDVQRTSLILLEFHHGEVREGISKLLDRDFELVEEKRTAWATLLGEGMGYRKDLAGDYFGTLCFANRNLQRMWRNTGPATPASMGLRELLRNLPGAVWRSARERIGRLGQRGAR